jgi:hypothetical protein
VLASSAKPASFAQTAPSRCTFGSEKRKQGCKRLFKENDFQKRDVTQVSILTKHLSEEEDKDDRCAGIFQITALPFSRSAPLGCEVLQLLSHHYWRFFFPTCIPVVCFFERLDLTNAAVLEQCRVELRLVSVAP